MKDMPMQDNVLHDPSKLKIIDFQFLKGSVEAPEDFAGVAIAQFVVDSKLSLAYSMENKLVKVDFNVLLETESNHELEAKGDFHFIFIFHVENFDELADQSGSSTKPNIKLHPWLANALSSVTYSTSRGVLLTRLQGTAFENFILPIINPTDLIVEHL